MAKHEKKHEKKRRGNPLITVIILILCGVMGFSGYKIFTILRNYHEGDSAYAGIAQSAVASSSGPVLHPKTESAASSQGEGSSAVPVEDKGISAVGIAVDFDALRAENSDVIGWLYQEGTVINYPVVQGSDNDYYLNHRFDGVYSSFGTLFVDYRNSAPFEGTWQTVIYGHHMKNGSMLASLDKYRKQSYYDEHPFMLLYTPEKTYFLELFSGYVATTGDWCYTVSGYDDFSSYLNYLQTMSAFESDVTVTEDDRIVMLSTCVYDFEDARFVVFGKLTEAEEE